ncbi:hypothetical protein HDU96_004276 [Phlyctochytrium bullatum]|nr:hypothetical protein HDU96_004276 [Phlyctochytrium bullatum]
MESRPHAAVRGTDVDDLENAPDEAGGGGMVSLPHPPGSAPSVAANPPLGPHHKRRSSQVLDPIDHPPRPASVTEQSGGPTWTRPSLSDVQKTKAEIEETMSLHSRISPGNKSQVVSTSAIDEVEVEGGEGMKAGTNPPPHRRRRRSSAAAAGVKPNSPVSDGKVSQSRKSVTGDASQDGRGGGKPRKSVAGDTSLPEINPKGTPHQKPASRGHGAGQGHGEEEDKALRDFLDGIGETDVPAASSSPNLDQDDDVIPGAVPEEFRNYLANGSSPTGGMPTSSPPKSQPPPATRIESPSPGASDNSIDRNLGEMRSKIAASTGGGTTDGRSGLNLGSTSAGRASEVQKPSLAARQDRGSSRHLAAGGRSSHTRQPSSGNADFDGSTTDGRSTPSEAYTDTEGTQSGPLYRNPPGQPLGAGFGHGGNSFSANNMGSGAIIAGPGAAKPRKKETPGTSAMRFLQCTLPGAVVLICMSLPVCYVMSALSSLAVKESTVFFLFAVTANDLRKDAAYTPLPITVISGIVSAVSVDFWVLATLCGCNVLRKWVKERWKGFRFLQNVKETPSKSKAGASGKTPLGTAAVLSQTTIQTVTHQPSESSNPNSAVYGRRNTNYTASGPSSIQLRNGGVGGSQNESGGNLFDVRVTKGIGHVTGEKSSECAIASLVNLLFFQVVRYFLIGMLFLFLQIPNPLALILITAIILCVIADTLIFGVFLSPFLRLHLLRTKNTALLILRTMIRPDILEATSVGYSLARSGGVESGAFGTTQASPLASSIPPAQYDTGPDYALNVVSSWTTATGLLFFVPVTLLLLSSPTDVDFFIPAFIMILIRMGILWLKFRVFTRMPPQAKVGIEDALEEEESAIGGRGTGWGGSSVEESGFAKHRPSQALPWNRTPATQQAPQHSTQPSSSFSGPTVLNESLFRLPIPRKSLLPLMAAHHMASSMAMQAAVGIAIIAFVLVPDLTFPPSLFGMDAIQPWQALAYNSRSFQTASSTTPLGKAVFSRLPGDFTVAVPSLPTMAWRAVFLIVMEIAIGAFFAAAVASPSGVAYGPSQQPVTTLQGLLTAQGTYNPTSNPSAALSSGLIAGGGATGGAGASGSNAGGSSVNGVAVDPKALRRSFSRRASAVRVANLNMVTVDPRLAVVSLMEVVRAMGVIGVALSCFWAAVWGLA